MSNDVFVQAAYRLHNSLVLQEIVGVGGVTFIPEGGGFLVSAGVLGLDDVRGIVDNTGAEDATLTFTFRAGDPVAGFLINHPTSILVPAGTTSSFQIPVVADQLEVTATVAANTTILRLAAYGYPGR
jgi:hypothetical protein